MQQTIGQKNRRKIKMIDKQEKYKQKHEKIRNKNTNAKMGIFRTLWNILEVILIMIMIKEQKYIELIMIIGILFIVTMIKECYVQLKQRVRRQLEEYFEQNAEEIIQEIIDTNQEQSERLEIKWNKIETN